MITSTRSVRAAGVLLALLLASALMPAATAGAQDSVSGATAEATGSATLATGYSHTCALTPDGAADCWGANWNWGGGADQPGPYTSITTGGFSTCALTPDGAADCWGGGWLGITDQPGPYTVITAGNGHTCALTPDGAADCWGEFFDWENAYGWPATGQPGPYTAISAGGAHVCALTPDGAADCWGDGWSGAAHDQPGPYKAIAAGQYHTCALTPDGAADCWGANWGGGTDQPGPYKAISAGDSFTCALTPDGAADCWGHNGYGQATDQAGPYTAVTAGYDHTCAMTPDGAADCWGHNGTGAATNQPGPYALPLAVASWLPISSTAGWHNEPVDITYTCTGGMGVVECPRTDLVTTDGADQQITAAARDGAGTLEVTNTIHLDTTAPAADMATGPIAGGALTGPATDELSGVDDLDVVLVPAIGQAITVEATLDCATTSAVTAIDAAAPTVGPAECTWTAEAPPGAWQVTLHPTDVAGNTTLVDVGAVLVLT